MLTLMLLDRLDLFDTAAIGSALIMDRGSTNSVLTPPLRGSEKLRGSTSGAFLLLLLLPVLVTLLLPFFCWISVTCEGKYQWIT